ncbi:MAG: hypothetical protein R6U32_01030 [Candidatus Woesearchaeota archaeon]
MIRASIKNGHIHCSIDACFMSGMLTGLSEFESMVKEHLDDENLTCIALKLSTENMREPADENEMIVRLMKTYRMIEEENIARPKKAKHYDGSINLYVEAGKWIEGCIGGAGKYLTPIRSYEKHVKECNALHDAMMRAREAYMREL